MIKFKGCKELDFDREKYNAEVVIVGLSTQRTNHACWERRDPRGQMQLCQFCKLRGRLNSSVACIGKENAVCHEYEEVTIVVD